MGDDAPNTADILVDSDTPQKRSLDSTVPSLPSDAPNTLPYVEVLCPPKVTPQTLDSSLPNADSGGLHIYFIFTGCSYERLTRPVQSGAVDPDQIRILGPTSSKTEAVETEIRDRLPAEHSIPTESDEITIPTIIPKLYTEAYEKLKSAVQSTDHDNNVSINLTTESPILSFAFFTAAAIYVLEYPSHRSLIDLYYVPPNEQDVAATIDSLIEDQPEREQTRSVRPTEMLFEYVHTDLEDRFEQLEIAWKTLNDEARIPSAVHDEMTTALEELRTTIEHIENDTNPRLVHKMEDTIWILSDYVTDLRNDWDEDPQAGLDSFQTEIDRLDTVISRLRTIVRDNRRLFTNMPTDTHPANQNKSIRSALSQQLGEPNIITADDHTTIAGVHKLPLPTANPRSIQQGQIPQAILQALAAEGAFDSVSALARHLADQINESYDESFRSKVQYNARTLAEKGFVTRERSGRSYRIDLSTMGKVWQQPD